MFEKMQAKNFLEGGKERAREKNQLKLVVFQQVNLLAGAN